jgi:hypothetical protein
MSVLVRFSPASLSAETYDESLRRLEESGDFPAGRTRGPCVLRTDGDLRLSEIWDSQERLQAFGERLMPLLAELGVEPGEPELLEVYNLVQR